MNAASKCLALHQDMALVQMYAKDELFSLPAWKEKLNASKTPQSSSKGENRVAKRKLYSPSGVLSEDEDKKVTPKRRRSSAAGDLSPPGGGSGSAGSSAASGGGSAVKWKPGGAVSGCQTQTPRMTVPLSERQQLALLMQMTAEEQPTPDAQTNCTSGTPGPLSPHSIGRRTPADKKLNKRNERGETALHVAAIRGDVKQMKKLIKSGADVNVKDYAGWTALHEACNHGWYDVARQLLNAGADVNVRGLENDTPLHDAAINGHAKLVQLLLHRGANAKQSNLRGKTPVDVAATDVIARLLRGEDDGHRNQVSSDDSDASRSPATAETSPSSIGGCISPRLTPGSDSNGCNSSSMPSTDAVQQRLYSPTNHISPGKSASGFSKRAGSSGSVTTPACGVLKNVMVSHHMDRSSSTPRLTLKFHHVKRHENGVATAADVSRLQAGVDSTSQLPSTVSAVSKTTSSISCVDSQYLTASSLGTRYHGGANDSECHQAVKNSFEKNQNSIFADNQQSVLMPFSPQFEDISDAEDDVKPATVNSRDSACNALTYGLSPAASPCLPSLSAALYASTASSTSAALTVSASYPPIVGWNNYSGFASQTAMTLPVPTTNVGQSFGRMLPWVSENHRQMGVVNHLSSVMSSTGSNGPVLTDDVQLNVSSRRPFSSSRFVSSDGVGCLKSEILPVKSEILSTDKSYGHQMSFNLENYNGHVGDVKSDLYIKAELPSSHAETSSQLCPSTKENKPNLFASQSKSEETLLSNRDTYVGSQHTSEDSKDDVKTESCGRDPTFGRGPSLHNSLQIKRDFDNMSPSRYSRCYQSPAASASPSLQSSCLEPDSAASSAQVTADVAQMPSNLEPKVPPLRIIIPSKVCSSGSLPDGSNTNTTSRCSVSSLPYVVSRTDSAESDVLTNTADEVHRSDYSPAVYASSDGDRLSNAKDASANSELVPAKRRKIKHSSKSKDEEKSSQKSGPESSIVADELRVAADQDEQSCAGSLEVSTNRSGSTSERRVTRASARSQQQRGRSSVDASCQRSDVEKDVPAQQVDSCNTVVTAATDEESCASSVAIVHRKHKKIHRSAAAAAAASQDTSSGNEAQVPLAPVHRYRKPANPYVAYRNIKMKVNERKKQLCTVVPKAPPQFSEFSLMTRRYALHVGQSSLLPVTPPPSGLAGLLSDLFVEQENARYQLRMQHIKERDRLVLLAEQEMLRIDCHQARAANYNHAGVLSVCSLLTVECGLYGGSVAVMRDASSPAVSATSAVTSESSADDRDVRSRCSARHFIAWSQEVTEKFDRLKEEMRLRHHHEADVLCAVQRLDWEWRAREVGSGIRDHPTDALAAAAAANVEMHVPSIPVDDELILMPA